MKFGLMVIGDEILSGRRRDTHVEWFRQILHDHGFSLAWVQILPDESELLVRQIRQSMTAGEKVFSCGGIGATPDDHTRQCAAAAAGVPLLRHPEAAALIERQFPDSARPHRIRMADLPEGIELIPNPVNEVPGFSINEHYFMPGFPDMSHPMGQWVLDHYYPPDKYPQQTLSLRVYGVSENELMPILEKLTANWPQLKLFSLPRMGEASFVELGFTGSDRLAEAFQSLQQELRHAGFFFVLSDMPERHGHA
ncbi:competence/damage-inducible protein A [Thiolapillus sp.]